MPERGRLQLFREQADDQRGPGRNPRRMPSHHPESLDLCRCFNVDLSGNLGKRCAERIQDLRQPLDSTLPMIMSSGHKLTLGDYYKPRRFPKLL